MNEKVKYWLDLSDYDYDTAVAMQQSGRYLFNIQSRYPSHKEKLMQGLTKERCEEILKNTKELQLWIKAKL
jgi:hypothetical protein